MKVKMNSLLLLLRVLVLLLAAIQPTAAFAAHSDKLMGVSPPAGMPGRRARTRAAVPV